MERLTRRRCLGLAAAATAGLAGCSATGDPDSAGGTTEQAQQASATATGTTASSTTASGDATSTGSGSNDASQADTETGTEAESESVYTQVYRETIGSVVSVRVTAADTPRGQSGGQGSGFVYDSNHVVTNAHVIGDADRVEVAFYRGANRTGRVVGRDLRADLAAVRIEQRPEYASPLSLVDEEPAVGTQVAAIGNPFGLDGTITSGIVSAVDRSIPSPIGQNARIPNGIQTDAPVNPGNSGGPLVNLEGMVAGVVNSGGGENIAFAISAPYVEKVVSALIAEGDYEHPYMGVSLVPVTTELARNENLRNTRGLFVRDVLSGTPANGALRAGDVLLAIDGTQVNSREALSSYLELETSPGDTVTLVIRRNGDRQQVKLTLGARPES